MAGVGAWLNSNWFTLLQSVGIICGLLFTAISIRRDTAARKATDLLTLSDRHHQLWSELHRRPELHRLTEKEVDLIAKPITSAEESFLELVIVHFFTGWLLAQRGGLLRLESLAADTRDFFSLPLPKAVWKESQSGRDPNFVRFINKSIGQNDSA